MKAYWQSLNERERWTVIIGLACLILYAYYLMIYNPLATKVKQRERLLIEKIETLNWMKQIKQPSSTVAKEKLDNGQLLTLLAKKLKDNSELKSPYQLQQTGSGDIQLSFEEVPFNFFLQWLVTLSNHYTITIKQFTASNTETPGATKLTLILSASE